MIDMVIFLSVKFCPCKIRYKGKILWDQRKATKEGLLTLRFFGLKKFFWKYIFFIIIKMQDLTDLLTVPFLWS